MRVLSRAARFVVVVTITVLGVSSAVNATPFVLNVSYDASVAGAPAGFIPAFNMAIQISQNAFDDPITINQSKRGMGRGQRGRLESSI